VKHAVIYARVSSDKQKEEHTIASQTDALRGFARQQGFSVPDEWVIEDEGYGGATLARPGLERVRDLAAEGQIDAVLVYSPGRLSRKYAYQVLIIEEFARHNVETVFIKAPPTATPEDQLLLQFQGMIAEYKRAQILERSRRGKGTVHCRELSTFFPALRMATDISERLSTCPHLTPLSTLRRLWCARSMNTILLRV
jgi:site-specific DNA recombinase